MIKSVNQLLNYECNSRCKMCSIWALGEDKKKMTPDDFRKLYSKEDFRTVEDLCISGGEPTLRMDIDEVMGSILPNLPNLKILFLSTNCSFPDRVLDFAQRNAQRVSEVYVVVSLEGNREVQRKIRGVDSYDLTLRVLDAIRNLKNPAIKSIISMTLQPLNCNIDSLEHVREAAVSMNSSFTFRPAGRSHVFYANKQLRNLELSANQITLVRNYITEHKGGDPYMQQLKKYLSGEETIMGSRDSGIKCRAGEISVFIQSDGTMYPCIYSTRRIGDKERGLYLKFFKLGDQEPCPCCTECQIYPMINYGGKNG